MPRTRTATPSRTASHRVRTAAALLTGVVLLAAGCGTDNNPGPRQQAPRKGTSDINPHPRDQLKPGGTLRLSIQQWITQYNVGHVDGTQGDGAAILALTQPALWFTDDNGIPSANPDVLAGAEVSSGGTQVVTYRINPRASWSDDSPITWKDFETQWRNLNGTAAGISVADSTGYNLISKVEQGADPREVRVTFTKPYADWRKLFDPLLPGSALDTPQEFNTGWIEKIPVWGGPWRLDKLDKTAQSITVVPNEKYWGTRPVLASIVFRALDASAITDAFLNKEIDQAPARQSETYRRLSGAPDTAIRIGARWDETHLTLGNAGPLADVRVRQAIGAALDRTAIAKAQAGDLPFTVNTLGNHFFMPGQDGYQDNAGVYGTFAPDRSKQLLTEAGWAEAGAGKPRTKDGKPLTLTYVVNSGNNSTVPQLVQNLLGQVGIKVDLRQVPSNDYFEKYVNPGAFDLVSFRFVDQIFPSDGVSIFQTGGGQNYGKFSQREVDDLLASAATETDPRKAVELYNKADVLLWQYGHSFELFQTPQVSAVRPGLANFGAYGLRSSRQYVDVGWVK